MIRVSDLPSDPAPGISLHCPRCQERYSAHQGDYFLARPDQIMRCDNGHRPTQLLLVQVRTVIQVIRR